jgi:hypothetical protein
VKSLGLSLQIGLFHTKKVGLKSEKPTSTEADRTSAFGSFNVGFVPTRQFVTGAKKFEVIRV